MTERPAGSPRPGRKSPSDASNLLSDLFEQALDPGYADAAASRAAGCPPRWPRASRAALLVVLVVIGMLFSVAYRRVVAARPQTSQARADLLVDIRHGQDQASDLQHRVEILRDEVNRLSNADISDSDLQAARRLAAAAGTGSLVGPGTVVRLVDAPVTADPVTGKGDSDNPGAVLDRDLQDVANALWVLGAEGIAINGQRLTSTTTIRTAGGAILVDFRPLTSPYEVVAVGPEELSQRFDRSATAKRFRRYVDSYRMQFSVKQRDSVSLPAAAEPRLRYASVPSASASAAAPQSSATAPATPATPTATTPQPTATPPKPAGAAPGGVSAQPAGPAKQSPPPGPRTAQRTGSGP